MQKRHISKEVQRDSQQTLANSSWSIERTPFQWDDTKNVGKSGCLSLPNAPNAKISFGLTTNVSQKQNNLRAATAMKYGDIQIKVPIRNVLAWYTDIHGRRYTS